MAFMNREPPVRPTGTRGQTDRLWEAAQDLSGSLHINPGAEKLLFSQEHWALCFLRLVNPEGQLLQTPCEEATLKDCVGPISASAAAPSVPGNSKTAFQGLHSMRAVLILTWPPHASLYLELGVFLPLFGDFLASKLFYEKCLIIAARKKIISNNLL